MSAEGKARLRVDVQRNVALALSSPYEAIALLERHGPQGMNASLHMRPGRRLCTSTVVRYTLTEGGATRLGNNEKTARLIGDSIAGTRGERHKRHFGR